jgi:hypothetical protein
LELRGVGNRGESLAAFLAGKQRPQSIDASGAEALCQLHVGDEEGCLSVSLSADSRYRLLELRRRDSLRGAGKWNQSRQ